MTKKDYIKLAQALRDARPSQDEQQKTAGWTGAINALVRVLAEDNPQFQSMKFYRAIVTGDL